MLRPSSTVPRPPVALVLLTLGAPGLAHAATWPAADTDWTAFGRGGVAVTDPADDGDGHGRDLVGSAEEPATYWYADGTHLMLRFRLDGDPLLRGELYAHGWGLFLDTDGDFCSYEWAYLLDASGSADAVLIGQNTAFAMDGDASDTVETVAYSEPLDYTATGNVRVTLAASTFGEDPDYFLDFALPLSEVGALGLEGLGVSYIAGAGGDGRSLTADLAGCGAPLGGCAMDNTTALPELTGAECDWEDPVAVDEDDDGDRDDDGLTNNEERSLGTDAGDPDSDDDGLADGVEVRDTLTDPNDADSDDGTLNDGDEVSGGTNPLDGSDDVAGDVDTGGGDTAATDTGTPSEDTANPSEDTATPSEDTAPTDALADTKSEGTYEGSCGCSSSTAAGGYALGLLAAALLARRRHR